MELSFQWLIGNFVVVISKPDLFVSDSIHKTPLLVVLNNLAALFEQTDSKVTANLQVVRLGKFGIQIVYHNQVLYDLNLDQVPRRLRVQRDRCRNTEAVPRVKLINVEERRLLTRRGRVQME